MPFLTLLSDYGSASHEPALIKGDLWGTHPALQIVDITHQVNRFDASQAAFLLADVLRHGAPARADLTVFKSVGTAIADLCTAAVDTGRTNR